jgi:hypothetical protein
MSDSSLLPFNRFSYFDDHSSQEGVMLSLHHLEGWTFTITVIELSGFLTLPYPRLLDFW